MTSLKTTHCPTCGTEHATSATTCPDCGRREAWHWPKIGAIAGVIGLFVLGIVFGPLAFFAGWRTREAGRGFLGAALMILGFVDFILPAWHLLQWQMQVLVV